MTWYTAYYGSWTAPDGVRHLDGTFSRKQAFENAQRVADRLHVTVTIKAERAAHLEFFEVAPTPKRKES